MEQVNQGSVQGRGRGAMRAVRIDELQSFVERWTTADDQLVQQWWFWEREALMFFGLPYDSVDTTSEVMHGVMSIAGAVCFGTLLLVKDAMRGAAPAALALAKQLFEHLPQFEAVIQAELRFRAGELEIDWSLLGERSGQAVVRTMSRRFRDETEH